MPEKLPREFRRMRTMSKSPKSLRKAVRKITMEEVKKRGRDVVGAKKMKDGGSLKAIPEGNKGKGLSKLPTEVRNKMGFMKKGGKVMKMRGGGMASRGLNFRMR